MSRQFYLLLYQYDKKAISLKSLANKLLDGNRYNVWKVSFANEERPIGNGRPDDDDLAAARSFGADIRAKLDGLSAVDETATITPPGNSTYIERDRSALADRCATTIEEKCTLCGECAPLCPVGAITVGDTVTTDNMACTLCNACVKSCPEGARVVDDPMINKIVAWVSKNFQARREPETFL